MNRGRAALALVAAALFCVGTSAAARVGTPTLQEVTIYGAGGVQLACGFALPAGTAPAGGWPGIVFFPRLGFDHDNEEIVDQMPFAVAGFASVSCDERGTGASGGLFDLAGPTDAADAQAIFDWFAGRSEVSDRQIGAYGRDLGGAEVWNAAVAGVPFKAIVPVYAWSSLARALRPSGQVDVNALFAFTAEGPPIWNTPSGIAARSYRGGLHSLTVPTLIVHGRAVDIGDLNQATAPYRLLGGPKRLLVVWDYQSPQPEVLAWFRRYLTGGPKVGQGVELQHESPDRTTTTFRALPATRFVSVNLPGSAKVRRVRLPGGPLETFGGGSVTIRYAGASWKQVVATVSLANGAFVTEGAMPVTHTAGLLKIPLLNQMTLLPRGKKLLVTLSSQSPKFGGSSGGRIAIHRVTLKLSVLQRAVSH